MEPTAEEWAREQLAQGGTVEGVVRQLIALGAGPIETIKALRATSGKTLGELKPIVDAALPIERQRANERNRDELARLLEDAQPHIVVEDASKFANVVAIGDGPYRCPCCGCYTLENRGGDEICQVCYWQDDGQDDHDADLVRGGRDCSGFS